MSHISTGVEYGLHCLLYLTQPQGTIEGVSVRDLAELQGVPNDFLAKLFTKLAKAGLVVASEGVKGGFRLARSPRHISVYDVIVAIDGDKSLFECREIRSRCAVFNDAAPTWATRGVCSIHAVMQMAEKAMREELKRHTLDDLSQRITDKAPAAYGEQIVTWLSDRTATRHGDNVKAVRPRARKQT
jgi:Rrf2 family protein